jgi:O-acetyl-ADP-ribose deacetylase (regulator of RNase III)/uncharacterized protein YwgA
MKIQVGDILKSNAQTLVNTVNCVGIMGKGIALEFKNRFPDMFKDYIQRCERHEVQLGQPYLYKPLFGQQIVNFPTKEHWKSISKLRDIERGLDYLLEHYKQWGITSIAIPPLGCGNGQLEWRAVGPLIYRYATRMDIPVEIYAPYGTNPAELTEAFLEAEGATTPTRGARISRRAFNPAWLGLIEIVRRIQQQPYHWPVGRVVFQKIAYVATREGLPTGFTYRRSSFGPYSSELKLAEAQLINSNLMQEERFGRMFAVRVGPAFEEMKRDYDRLLNKYTGSVEKTTDLFVRVDTKQAEILATVIFAADELKANGTEQSRVSEMDVLDAVMKWKQRRRPPLNETSVASTIRNLGMLGWLDVEPDDKLPIPEEDMVLL